VISKAEYQAYEDKCMRLDDGQWLCWLCKNIVREEADYFILDLKSDWNDEYRVHVVSKLLWFHKVCFEEIAGEGYRFES
jgi:hypothetical protein